MSELSDLLEKDFVIVDLGAAGASDLKRLRNISSEITLVELDVTTESKTDVSRYHKRVFLKKAVAGRNEKRVLHERAFGGASSFLQPKAALIQDYGLQNFFTLCRSTEVECQTLPDLLQSVNLHRVDFLKTDLEGLDFEVLTSAQEILASTLVVQSESRFQPFYENEPSFFTVGNYLSSIGFELISMLPETWKYKTPRSHLMRNGRLVFADAIFFLSPNRVAETFGAKASQAFVKQILVASALGLSNYAEHLYEKLPGNLSPALLKELGEYVRPLPGRHLGLIRAANLLLRIKGGRRILYWLRTAGFEVYQCATIYSPSEHLAPNQKGTI